jgi:hypothetical protein
MILENVDPLQDNDREISNYIAVVTRQRPVNSNRETVFSVRSVLTLQAGQVRVFSQITSRVQL